ncbi:MAG: XisI protein [Limnoraphis robusta]|jgi:hypothetical protein
MDRLEHYRQCIQKLLLEHCQGQSPNGEFEVHPIFDRERDHYLIVDFGWDNYRRIYNCVMHLNIQNNKVWIQRNQTDYSLAEELVSLGIPKEDIVLGVQPISIREYTGFGVASE